MVPRETGGENRIALGFDFNLKQLFLGVKFDRNQFNPRAGVKLTFLDRIQNRLRIQLRGPHANPAPPR